MPRKENDMSQQGGSHGRALRVAVVLLATMTCTLAYARLANATIIQVNNTAELQNVFGKNDPPAAPACNASLPPFACPVAGDTIMLAGANFAPTASLDVNINNLTIMGPSTSPAAQITGSAIARPSSLTGNPDIFAVAAG